jgi:sugar lactone lactonase YvrE
MLRRLGAIVGLSLALTLAAGAAPVAAHAPDHHPARFPARIDLPAGFSPEGITAGRGTTVFVGSLVDGAIWKGNVRTGMGRILVPGVAGNVAVGVEYERRANRLWVAGGASGAVRVYNASTGALLQTYSFAPVGFLNDLVVTSKAVYVTDSGIQQLDVIPLGRHGALPAPTAARILPLTGDIAFETGFNANGIVASGKWLVLVQTNTGKLFRVVPGTGVTKLIDLGGASVTFGDGLELHGRTLYVVRNQLNQVDVFKLGRHLATGRLKATITSPDLDVPTTIAFQAGRLWAVNARFNTPVTPTTEYWITRLPARR